MSDPVKVRMSDHEIEYEIEALDDGRVLLAFRTPAGELAAKFAGTDAMAMGRDLMRAATLAAVAAAAAAARKAEEGAKP